MPIDYTTKPALPVGQRRANNANMEEAGMTDLAGLIAALDPVKCAAVSEQLKKIEVSKLIATNTNAILKKQRTSAFLIALELTERGIAPFFRRSDLAPPESSIRSNDQEYDLLVYDLMWLAEQHKGFSNIKVTSDPCTWGPILAYANRLFWLGNQPIYRIVKNLKLTEVQQWECELLKSGSMKNKARGLHQSAAHIYGTLAESLPTMTKTGMTDAKARAALIKRKRLWFCAEMCGWKPTETGRLYRCMTGEQLTKSAVANQLSAIVQHRRRRARKPKVEEIKIGCTLT